ncbi:MAG: ABC transporter permease [Coriobacteriia bacterium]|nr:ABC transporter permease [Coriobacteriia bacterium]MBN2840535.1 ABC transporter permease [Coriobacteriia bacterium]
MRGFGVFLGKELREIGRTWRIWVLPGIVLFFAASGPPLAKITPELLSSLVDTQGTGMVIQLPDPTYVDAYLQWTKNLSQIVIFALIIMFAGAISAEKRGGTAILALTKPLSRTAFVVGKLVSHTVLLVVTTVVGAAVTWGLTFVVFGEAPLGPLAGATGAWLISGVFFVALMMLLSATMDSQAGAAGVGLVVYLLLSIATVWEPAVNYSPAGLVNAPTGIAMSESVPLGWPIGATIALAMLFAAAAIVVFRRREL